MAGVFGSGDFIANTTTTSGGEAGPFVPELWSNEIIAAYKQNLVLANLVTRMNHVGKKGDTINIPKPTRGAAHAKAQETEVTTNNPSNNMTSVSIDQHYEYSTLIEDFADLQALGSMRRFLTDDAGYALAKQVDWSLHRLASTGDAQLSTYAPGAVVSGDEYDGATTGVVLGSDGSTAFDDGGANGTSVRLSDAGIRQMVQTLDDADVPLMNRAFVVPPVEKNNLLGIARFTENAFTGEAGAGNSIRNGLIGDLYNNPFYVSTNCVKIDQSGGSTADVVAGLYLHQDAWVLIMQQNMRAQSAYMQQYLATLFTADLVYGKAVLRAEGFVPFIVGV